MRHASIDGERGTSIMYKNIKVSSTAFKDGEMIPGKYTCDGKNVNPELKFDHIPEETRSLTIIVDDPDAPIGTWVHWLIWDIPVTHLLKENDAPGIQGVNDFRKNIYSGPCPPSAIHRYFFKVYALDCRLQLPKGSKKTELEKAMTGHILGFGELTGLYKKD